MFHILSIIGDRSISIVPPIACLLSYLDQGICLSLGFFVANNILLSIIVNSSIIGLVVTLGVVGISPGSLIVNMLAK